MATLIITSKAPATSIIGNIVNVIKEGTTKRSLVTAFALATIACFVSSALGLNEIGPLLIVWVSAMAFIPVVATVQNWIDTRPIVPADY